MDGDDFRKFIFENKIKQRQVVEYLGVSKGYISLVINGKKKLSNDNLDKLICNPYGWDVSMLMEQSKFSQTIGDGSSNNTQVIGSTDVVVLQERIKHLEEMLAEKERTIQILLEKK